MSRTLPFYHGYAPERDKGAAVGGMRDAIPSRDNLLAFRRMVFNSLLGGPLAILNSKSPTSYSDTVSVSKSGLGHHAPDL